MCIFSVIPLFAGMNETHRCQVTHTQNATHKSGVDGVQADLLQQFPRVSPFNIPMLEEKHAENEGNNGVEEYGGDDPGECERLHCDL